MSAYTLVFDGIIGLGLLSLTAMVVLLGAGRHYPRYANRLYFAAMGCLACAAVLMIAVIGAVGSRPGPGP